MQPAVGKGPKPRAAQVPKSPNFGKASTPQMALNRREGLPPKVGKSRKFRAAKRRRFVAGFRFGQNTEKVKLTVGPILLFTSGTHR